MLKLGVQIASQSATACKRFVFSGLAPNRAIVLVYVGAIVLAIGALILGVTLTRAALLSDILTPP